MKIFLLEKLRNFFLGENNIKEIDIVYYFFKKIEKTINIYKIKIYFSYVV